MSDNDQQNTTPEYPTAQSWSSNYGYGRDANPTKADTEPPAKTNPSIRTPESIGISNAIILAQECLRYALAAETDEERHECVISARYWLNY